MLHFIDSYVSSETLQKFQVYERLLREWNRRTGLVQEDTLAQFDTRHILDSLQIIPIIHELSSPITQQATVRTDDQYMVGDTIDNPLNTLLEQDFKCDVPNDLMRELSLIDIGTGAGFPGMVLAICGFKNVHLCESNEKKCIFLEEVARQTDTHVTILNQRIENITTQYDGILSRAFSELDRLLGVMGAISRSEKSYGLFHKGRSWKEEIIKAHNQWNYSSRIYRSVTSKDGVILAVQNIYKK